ncbi:MAG: hypothetical protein CMJ85_07820 [Planctomycetes bacterium]|nr:hypothetical protein [Planctomycetota bacterium]
MGMPTTSELQQSLDLAFDIDESETTAGGAEPFEPAVDATCEVAMSSYEAPTASQQLPWYAMALVFIVGGLGIGTLDATSSISPTALTSLGKYGASPMLLVVCGLIVLLLARAQARSTTRNDSGTTVLLEELATIRSEVAQVVTVSQHAGNGDEAGTGIALLAKLEAMISNLTKAVRMHTKPLGDLVGMLTDHRRSLQETDKALLAVKLDLEAIEKAVGEVVTSGEKRWEGMFERLHGSENELEASLAKSRELIIDQLEPQILDESTKLTKEIEAGFAMLHKEIETKNGVVDAATINQIAERFVEQMPTTAPTAGATDAEREATQRALAATEQKLTELIDAVTRLEHRPVATPTVTTEPTLAEAPARTMPEPEPEPAATQSSSASADPEEGGKFMNAIERLKQLRNG